MFQIISEICESRDMVLEFNYITSQGYIGNNVNNLIKFSCYITLRSPLTSDRNLLEVMSR